MDNLDKISFATILIFATQSTRLLPLILKEHLEKYLNFDFIRNHLGDLIILFLIFYCYRDFNWSEEFVLRVVIGCLVFGIQWFKDNSLLSIFLGTTLYMTGRAFL
jgi:branched-subunit amino acid transport protein AzlD